METGLEVIVVIQVRDDGSLNLHHWRLYKQRNMVNLGVEDYLTE